MIILDTNVLSELMRPTPEPAVIRWLDDQPADSIWITTITVFETRYGLALLPNGKRRQALEDAFVWLIIDDLDHRVLDLEATAAVAAATLAAARQKEGRTIDVRDTLLAGIAIARRATLATRNTHHFADLDVRVVNPWDYRAATAR